jgi:hypothetical protein
VGARGLGADSKKAADERAHLVLIDESGLRSKPLVRRTWAVRGRTPVLGAWGRYRQKVSAIGAVSVSPVAHRLGLYFATDPKEHFNGARIVVFLRDLLRHLRGKVIVVGRQHQPPEQGGPGVPESEPSTVVGAVAGLRSGAESGGSGVVVAEVWQIG